jgi:putative DNA primase/helicase
LNKRKQHQISKLDFPLTELGNAERFVAQYGDKIRYCIDNKEWYIYNGKKWETDEKDRIFLLAEETIRKLFESASAIDDEEVAEAVRKHARASESLNKLTAMRTLSSTQPGIPIRLNELDAQDYLVNLNNGTLDLRTKTLHPHDRKELISRLIPLDYDPNLKSELWERTLGLILKPEAVSFMQRLLGYCLTGSTKEQKMFIP